MNYRAAYVSVPLSTWSALSCIPMKRSDGPIAAASLIRTSTDCLAAVQQEGEALEFVPEALKKKVYTAAQEAQAIYAQIRKK